MASVGSAAPAFGRSVDELQDEFTIGRGDIVWCNQEFSLPAGEQSEGGREFVPLTIEYEFCPTAADSECIGCFSLSRKQWGCGNGGEDALTWYAAPHRGDFHFRTAMFAGFLERYDEQVSSQVAGVDDWHRMKVELTRSRASYSIDDRLIASAPLVEGAIPVEGFVGFVSYASQWSARGLRVREHSPLIKAATKKTPFLSAGETEPRLGDDAPPSYESD